MSLLVALWLSAGVDLGRLTWEEAKAALTPETVVVIPMGAAAKEHGPHLKLDNDFVLAEGLTERVRAQADVVIAPTINYGFYPAFVEYPGSTTLSQETSTAMVVEIVRSLAYHGPRRFYVLNTGISTLRALAPAAEILAKEGILLTYTNLIDTMRPVEKTVAKQPRGTHADEIETSIMLVLAPKDVDMKKAKKDIFEWHKGMVLSPVPKEGRIHSATGIFGDATLATKEKGKVLVDALVSGILKDISALKSAPLPQKQ